MKQPIYEYLLDWADELCEYEHIDTKSSEEFRERVEEVRGLQKDSKRLKEFNIQVKSCYPGVKTIEEIDEGPPSWKSMEKLMRTNSVLMETNQELMKELKKSSGTYKVDLVRWVVQRWKAEVAERPLKNIHRRTLDDTWRQIYRHLTGREMQFPTHDELLAKREDSDN
jgi:hypothetical protein